jgi:chromosome segregation protein
VKLLSIKAHGFKSFADKIEIEVGDGITGIVGPNGSGKSNVVDAVRWVLGESSLKEIRGGDTMTDVIFQGSQTRDPSSRAWVSLTFDNRDHYLASEFDEIEIKREVYKTGESEYYINNSKVRKKDITDLFIDSGSSPDSYSIIGQGKIAEILKGRPLDRRAIIEEAAGVLKYKKRKEETMRKLDNTNDNLEKVNLVIQELEVNVNPLREQAEIAKKYVEYKEELKGIEIALLASDINNINNTYSESKERLEKSNEELLTLDNSNSVDSSKLESLKTKNIKLDEDISKSSDELIRTNSELAELETKKQVISERKKYKVDDQKLQNNILLLKDNEIEFKKVIASLEGDIKSKSKEIESINEDIEKYENDYKSSTLRKNSVITEINNKVQEEISLKNRINILNDAIENDTKLPFAVKSVLNNPRLNGIHNVLTKLIEVDEKYTTAIETALGANQNVIVVDDEKCGTNAINYLKDNKLGRATFFPISIIKGRTVDESIIREAKEVVGFIDVASNLVKFNPMYQNIVDNQLGNTLIVDNIDSMNKLGKKLDYRYRVITLDGELLHTGGSMTGGFKKNSSGLLNDRLELEKCTKDLSIVTNQKEKLQSTISELDKEIEILQNKLFELKGNRTSKQEALLLKTNELESNKTKLKGVQDEINGTSNVIKDELDKELDEVLKKYLEVSVKKEELQSKLNGLKSNKNDLLNEIEELELINKKANSEYNKKLNEIRDLEVSIGKMDIKLDNLLNRLSEEYQLTFEKAKADYVLDLDEEVARSKVNRLKRDIRDLGEVNVGSIQEFERVNTRYTFLTDQREDLNNAINDLLEVINDLDKTMIERFEATFNEVNKEFGEVFKKLFKGGSAKLILTDPEDMLNTGVDIDACPPGKSLKSMTSLSGGEMTLTAIALLFSILNIRTVPFCILDEVEAALDEANVDIFGTYIKNYESKSQFVVITHKKRTMEYANNLYGITMQESGVSKLVSVRLENIE